MKMFLWWFLLGTDLNMCLVCKMLLLWCWWNVILLNIWTHRLTHCFDNDNSSHIRWNRFYLIFCIVIVPLALIAILNYLRLKSRWKVKPLLIIVINILILIYIHGNNIFIPLNYYLYLIGIMIWYRSTLFLDILILWLYTW